MSPAGEPLPGLEAYTPPPEKTAAKRSGKKIHWESFGAVKVPIYQEKDRFRIVYRPHKKGGRIKVAKSTLAEAKTAARKICEDIARGQISAGRLTSDQLLQAAAALEIIGPRGWTLDGLAREAEAAVAAAGGASLAEMARFWARHHRAALKDKSVQDVYVLMLKDVEKQEYSPRWRQSLEKDLKRFVDAFAARPVGELTSDEIQEWLNTQKGNWRTFNNRLALVRQYFVFARLRGYLPDGVTEAEKIKKLQRPRGQHRRIGVLSADQLAGLLEWVGVHWRPYVALGAFAGLRREETMRLEWADVLWEEKAIHIRQEVAKSTGRKAGDERFVPMSAQLLAWLSPWSGKAEGKICERRAFEDERERLRLPLHDVEGKLVRPAVITYDWPKNALRHTFGSCRTAETKNMAQVAHEMGNSVAEVRRDYNNPRTAREVQAWLSIYPPGWLERDIVAFVPNAHPLT